MPDEQHYYETAVEISHEVVDSFSELHPHLRMSRQEWEDLRNMIIREIMGRCGTGADGKPLNIHAADLLPSVPKNAGRL